MKQYQWSFLVGLLLVACSVPLAVRAITVEISAVVPGCGDGVVAGDEQCDGANVQGASCTSLGFVSGTLSCTSACTFNTIACTSGTLGGSQGGGSSERRSDWAQNVAVIPATNVVLSGRAYPFARVHILKDGQLRAETNATQDGSFTATISDLATGMYSFAAYGQDTSGLRSSLFTFPITIQSGVTTKIGEIFIAPTIMLDKSEVAQGDTVSISGHSVPGAVVTVSISADQESLVRRTTDVSGAYTFILDTSSLAMGQYTVKSKAEIAGESSPYGKTFSVIVGTQNQLAKILTQEQSKVDLNDDDAIDLIDFSIIAFWYGRASPPARVDLNGDGAVDLIDLSIMAFYWTG